MLISVGMLHRFRMPRLPIAASCKLRWQRIGFIVALFMDVCSSGQSYGADPLECPEIGSGPVPDLIDDAAGGGLLRGFLASRRPLSDGPSRRVP
jgi:hypothetical protein